MADETPKGDLAKSGGDSKKELLKKLRTSKRISWVLDECIRIPGTQIRFGLDPILGLIPYGGETVATIFGAFILGDAGKKGLPIKTLTKMSGNMMINAGIGWIPVVGDLFSFWFKSNTRNYRMLNTYLDSDHGEEDSGGWWPVILVISVIGFVLIMNLLAWVFITGLILWAYPQLTGVVV
ncbi:MAG: DUF4112 domain-containing protein [Verrucomicrobiales bacterium]|nr:DUF4112 domain-containing protein [Verrucomicrobiales bacterium]